MKHLALAVSDQQRSRRFYETYFGFDAQPAQRYDDGVLMLFNRHGFSLALGETDVHAFRRRLADDGIPIVEEWDEPDYVSVKCSDPDGYVVEAAWEPDRLGPLADE
jgi:catechol 2,3-dioxygenase-like lactoylglutathione lyase family enzyme